MNEHSAPPSRRRFGAAGALWAYCSGVRRDGAADLRRAGEPGRSTAALWAGGIFAAYATLAVLLPLCSWWSVVFAPPVFLALFRLTGAAFANLAAREARPFTPTGVKYLPRPWCVAAAVFGVYSVMLWRWGVITSPDTADQWEQIATGHFDDWHPVMHTLSIYFFAAVRRSQFFVLECFIAVFSLLCAWLCATLRRFGCRRSVVWALLLLTTASPNALFASRVLWKDSEFALALLYLGIAMVHLWHTDGAWLRKLRHALPTAAVLVYAAFVRHNGIFFVVPFLLLLPLLPRTGTERRRLAAFAAAVLLALAAYIAVRGVLIRRGVLAGRCGDVEQKRSVQGFGEAVGMPMTMMGEAFVKNPGRTPVEAAEFLSGIAPREKWEELFAGDFNSVKFATLPRSSTVFNDITPAKFARMFLATCAACPRECFVAFVRLTALAWDPLFRMSGAEPEKEYAFPYALAYRFGLDRLWSAPGLGLLLVFFAGAFAFVRRGWRVLFMILPFAAYCFGTALLLSGWDHRFFWGVIVASPVAAAALLRAPRA